MFIGNPGCTYEVFKDVVEQCTNLETLVLSGKYKTIESCGIKEGTMIHMVLRLRGGKPVILFYPPSEGPHAKSKAFNVSTSVTLNPACRFTTLMPRPEMSIEGNNITWNGIVDGHTECDSNGSSLISVDGRKHGYLFWEFTGDDRTDDKDIVKKSIGVQSIVEHAENAYILNGIEEYEEWCHVMLGKIGLNPREQDDFATFWARSVYECGPIVIARVVPECELCKCAKLEVKARSDEDSEEVEVDIHRVYVSMVVSRRVPDDFSRVFDKLQFWKDVKSEDVGIPTEVRDIYPIHRDAKHMTVIEWGGIVITL